MFLVLHDHEDHVRNDIVVEEDEDERGAHDAHDLDVLRDLEEDPAVKGEEPKDQQE